MLFDDRRHYQIKEWGENECLTVGIMRSQKC